MRRCISTRSAKAEREVKLGPDRGLAQRMYGMMESGFFVDVVVSTTVDRLQHQQDSQARS